MRENPEGQILPFLDYALSYLEQDSILETQGLFRLSANKPQLDALRVKIDKGRIFSSENSVFYEKEKKKRKTVFCSREKKLPIRKKKKPKMFSETFMIFFFLISFEQSNKQRGKKELNFQYCNQRLPKTARVCKHADKNRRKKVLKKSQIENIFLFFLGNHEFTPEELEDPHMVTGIVKLFLRYF